MKTAEAAFKGRYRVVHPAETPIAPKRPVGLIAIAIGVMSTIAAVLAVAALAKVSPMDLAKRNAIPVVGSLLLMIILQLFA